MLHVRFLSSRVLLCILLLAAVSAVESVTSARAQDRDGSQDETLVGNVNPSGGYGAPTVALTRLNGEPAAMVGGQGGLLLNRRFVLGGAVRGITPRPTVDLRNRDSGDPASAQLQLGYVGQLVVGGGTVELVDDQSFRAGASVSEDSFDRAGAFVSEVGARAELNVTSFFRIGLSGGYRLVAGGNLEKADVSNGDLSAPYGQLSFRFGSF